MGWTPNMDEGYLDGLHGRNNRECSPNYVEGWEAGWRERSRITSTTAFWVMMAWDPAAQPAPDLTHDAEGRN